MTGGTAATTTVRWRRPDQLLVGAVLVGAVLVAGLLAPLLAGYDPLEQIPRANLLSPSGAHLFGTDELNRDLFSRVIYGVRTTVIVLAVAVPIGAVVGIAIGLVAALERFADVVSARFFDVILAFPAIILAITVTALRGPGIVTVIIAIAITEIPVFGRLARDQAARVSRQPFVESARLSGASTWWVVRNHILPNSLEPLIVQLALSLSLAVFVESAMSFIGVGTRPPAPSLGSILADGVYAWDVNPAYPLAPLTVIAALALGFLLIAQGIAERSRDR